MTYAALVRSKKPYIYRPYMAGGVFGALSIDEAQKLLDQFASGYSGPCSVLAVQKMLDELGYPPGPIDGILGVKTNQAANSFALAHGVAYTPPPSGAFCKALLGAYAQQKGLPMQGGSQLPTPGGGGSWIPSYVSPQSDPPQSPPAQPAPAPAQEPGLIDKTKAWWGKQSTGVKVAVGVSGGLVTLGLLRALLAPAYAANPRFEAPNLDAMPPDELDEFYRRYRKSRKLLAQYAHLKAGAMRLRAAGHIDAASRLEDQCDAIYQRLPSGDRW